MKAAIALLLIAVAIFLGWEIIRGNALNLLSAAGNPTAQAAQSANQGSPKPGGGFCPAGQTWVPELNQCVEPVPASFPIGSGSPSPSPTFIGGTIAL